jgi:hypothetical protein
VLLFYVDNILLAYHHNNRAAAEQLISSIISKYQIEDHRAAKWFLGVRIIQDQAAQTIILAHNSYIKKLAAKFDILGKGSFPSIPFPVKELRKHKGEASKQEIKAY